MDSNYTIYTTLQRFCKRNMPVSVATVINTTGSVPRQVGAKMLIRPDGEHVATIGGGHGEALVIDAGLAALKTAKPTVVHVDLTGVAQTTVGVCGGSMDILVEPCLPNSMPADTIKALIDAARNRHRATLLTVVAAPDPALIGRQVVVTVDGLATPFDAGPLTETVLADARNLLTTGASKLLTYQADAWQIFVETQVLPRQLVMVGAGHIAQPLAKLAKMLDFEVTVIDDRAEFANCLRFPGIDNIFVGEADEVLGHHTLDRDTFVALITRGFEHDVACLDVLLNSEVAYIGMLGSRRRVQTVFDTLSGKYGRTATDFERVQAPIGLDLGGETPAEIAVEIMAQVIQVARGLPVNKD